MNIIKLVAFIVSKGNLTTLVCELENASLRAMSIFLVSSKIHYKKLAIFLGLG